MIETLRTDGQAVHTGIAVAGQAAVLDRARVHLHRHFAVVAHRKRTPANLENVCDPFRRKKARRATTEEDAVDESSVRLAAFSPDVAGDCFDVTAERGFGLRPMRVEIAVGTLADAPRQVQIEREGRQWHYPARPDPANSSCSARNARPRWLTAFFSSGDSSAPVFPEPGSRKTGS